MKETHLIVLWNRSRVAERQLLAEIGTRFSIRRVYEICWTAGLAKKNFRRFYGVRLPGVDQKLEECGTGPFLVVVADVPDPVYDVVMTSRGHELAVQEVFAFKTEVREKRGLPIHATNSTAEFAHDLFFLTGLTAEAFDRLDPDRWDGQIVRLERDIVGEGGWKDAAELLQALKVGPRHVIMRGVGEDGTIDVNRSRDDVDILTDASEDIRLALGGEFHIGNFFYRGYAFSSPIRGKLAVRIGGEETLFDIYDVKYRYYDPLWEEDMLATREFKGGAYRLNETNAQFEHLYHQFFHKMADVPDGDKSLTSLFDFLFSRGYSVNRPLDATIHFNDYLLSVRLVKRRLEMRFGFSQIRQIHFAQSARRGGSLYFSAEGPDGKVFVKVARDEFARTSPSLEFRTMERAHAVDRAHIVRPIRYSDLPELRSVSVEFVDGRLLEDVLKDGRFMSANGDRLADELLSVLKALHRAGVVHRDIRPSNLIVGGDGHIRLFDFQFAVFHKWYSESSGCLLHPEWIQPLGGPFAPGDYRWDDAHSVSGILALFPQTEAVRRITAACAGAVGKLTITFPRIRLFKYGMRMKLAGLIPVSSIRHRVKDRIRGLKDQSVEHR